jgi:hypothetical protein
MAQRRVEQPNNSPVARHWSVTNSVFVQHEGSNATAACDAYWPHSDGFWMLAAADGELRSNSFTNVCEGYNVEISSRLFFADNHIIAVGTQYSEGNGFSHFAWPQVVEHIYVGNSTQVGNPAASVRQETMSFDGDGSIYYGPPTSVEGHTTVRIPADPIRAGINYTGLLFHVASGSGIGQTRRIVGWQGTRENVLIKGINEEYLSDFFRYAVPHVPSSVDSPSSFFFFLLANSIRPRRRPLDGVAQFGAS